MSSDEPLNLSTRQFQKKLFIFLAFRIIESLFFLAIFMVGQHFKSPEISFGALVIWLLLYIYWILRSTRIDKISYLRLKDIYPLVKQSKPVKTWGAISLFLYFPPTGLLLLIFLCFAKTKLKPRFSSLIFRIPSIILAFLLIPLAYFTVLNHKPKMTYWMTPPFWNYSIELWEEYKFMNDLKEKNKDIQNNNNLVPELITLAKEKKFSALGRSLGFISIILKHDKLSQDEDIIKNGTTPQKLTLFKDLVEYLKSWPSENFIIKKINPVHFFLNSTIEIPLVIGIDYGLSLFSQKIICEELQKQMQEFAIKTVGPKGFDSPSPLIRELNSLKKNLEDSATCSTYKS